MRRQVGLPAIAVGQLGVVVPHAAPLLPLHRPVSPVVPRHFELALAWGEYTAGSTIGQRSFRTVPKQANLSPPRAAN